MNEGIADAIGLRSARQPALEDDEVKRDSDVVHVLPGRATALIQEGYAVAVEDDKPAVKRAKKR